MAIIRMEFDPMNRNRLFRELIEIVAQAPGEKSLKRALSRFRANHGYDHFAFLNLHAQRVHAVSDYPKEWQATYLARSYTIIDPVISSAKRVMRPFEWSSDRERRRAESDVKRFYDEAASFGIRSGVSIPVRTGRGRFAILTLASSHNAEIVRTAADPDIVSVASAVSAVTLLHTKFAQAPANWEPADLATPIGAINARERACLKGIAEGKRMADIAVMEGIAYGTVAFHLSNAKAKLDALTLPHATWLATKLSLI